MTGRRFETDTSVEPTFTGYIETTLDALLIFEACRQRIVPKIPRRLHDKERHLIQSGSVFVFQETEAGIKRWTDGLVWSPSRILGNFLIYRELNKKNNANEPSQYEEQVAPELSRPQMGIGQHGDMEAAAARRQKERALVGSLTGSPKYKEHGLIKKTISLAGLHMISYYDVQDVLDGKLRTPSSLPELNILEPSPDFLQLKAFRQPPLIEVGPDGVPRYRAENAGNEQQPVPQMPPQMPPSLPPMHHPHYHHPVPSHPVPHMMPMPQRGPVPVPHHMGRMPPMQLPMPQMHHPMPSPPPPQTAASGGSAGSGGSAHSAHSSAGGYVSPGQERPNPMLGLPPIAPIRTKSPLETEPGRPGLPRSQSSGSPGSRQGPPSAGARYEPYSQQGRRNDQRPHTSSAEAPEQPVYDNGYAQRTAFSQSMPPSMAHDERYGPVYSYGHYAPSMYAHERAAPSYIPAAHLPVPIPHAHGYDPHGHHQGSYPPPPVAPRTASGSYESDSHFAYRPESPQSSRANGAPEQQYAVRGKDSAAMPRSAGEHVHPASAPATQTSFDYGSGGRQPSGLVASTSPEPEDQWFERQ